MPDSSIKQQLIEQCDRCVKCGMCLPECPTYHLSRDENASPRGRIALIQAWQSGKLPLNDRLVEHLEECLVCRRCERICPSLVPYGEIITTARQQLHTLGQRKTAPGTRLLLKLVTFPAWQKPLRGMINFARLTGLTNLLRRLPGTAPYLSAVTSVKQHHRPRPSATEQRVRVGLFSGCLTSSIDRQTLHSAINVLEQLGYEVFVPAEPHCCGALHWQQGETDEALRQAEKSLAMMKQQQVEHWISLVNGCTAHLSEYAQLPLSQQAREDYSSIQSRLVDLVSFLARAPLPDSLASVAPPEEKLLLHLPCTLRNSLRAEKDLFQLISRLPGKNLPTEAINHLCCGAAGSYMLNQPGIARELRDLTLNALPDEDQLILLTSNSGCALHLRAGLPAANRVTIMHPVTYIERLIAASERDSNQ